MNSSKIRSAGAWRKWQKSGAIAVLRGQIKLISEYSDKHRDYNDLLMSGMGFRTFGLKEKVEKSAPKNDPEALKNAKGWAPFLLLGQRDNREVVLFAGIRLTDDALEITGPQDLPKEWAPGRDWRELNIFPEMYLRPDPNDPFNLKKDVIDYGALHTFIRAFEFKPGEKMFMHVWKSRLPEYASSPQK